MLWRGVWADPVNGAVLPLVGLAGVAALVYYVPAAWPTSRWSCATTCAEESRVTEFYVVALFLLLVSAPSQQVWRDHRRSVAAR